MKTGHWKSCKLLKYQHGSEGWQKAGGLKGVCLYLLLDSSWTSAPGLLRQATLTVTHWRAMVHNSRLWGYLGSPRTFMKSLPICQCAAADPEKLSSDYSEALPSRSRAELPRSCTNPVPQEQGKEVSISVSVNGLHFWFFMARLTAWRSLACWPCCYADSPAALVPAHSPTAQWTQNRSEGAALEASNRTQSYQGKPKKIWIALYKDISSMLRSGIGKGSVALYFQSPEMFTLFWKWSFPGQ